MAKVKIDKTVEVCDFCHCEGYLQECIRCHKMFCLTDNAIVPGCWVSPTVCRKCGESDEVKSICDKYADKITPLIRKRNDEIASSMDARRLTPATAREGKEG